MTPSFIAPTYEHIQVLLKHYIQLIVDIQELRENEKPPLVYITDLIINDESKPLHDYYKLPYRENNIQIRFVGLSYKSQGNIIYKYKMDGVDKDWIEAGQRQKT